MGKTIYDKSKLDVFNHQEEMEEMIEALDDVLYSACIYYLDVEKRGVPMEADSNHVVQVRYLLETLRSTIVKV